VFKVLLCIQSEHNTWLVGLASLVCVAATQATFFLYAKASNFAQWSRWSWLMMTGLVAGSGIWTTHFVAMLAFQTGLPKGYAVLPTALSLLVAVASAVAGFALASADRLSVAKLPLSRIERSVGGGLLVGLGITAMHYVGMLGYRTTGHVQWDGAYVAASVGIGAVLAFPALLVAGPGAAWPKRVLAGLILTSAIVGMHFTGMTAVTITPDSTMIQPPNALPDSLLAAWASGGAALIMVAAISGVALDAVSRSGSLRYLRRALDVMPEGLAYYDASDRLMAWNTHYESMCRAGGVEPYPGMPFTELINREVVPNVYPGARGQVDAWIERRLAARRGDIDSVTDFTASGRWVRITDRRTADGGAVSVSVDVTELKAAELKVIEARDRAEQLAKRAEIAEAAAGLGHWRLDVRTSALAWSPQMYAIYGLDPSGPVDLDMVKRMSIADDRESQSERIARRPGDGDGQEAYILRILRGDGQVRFLEGRSWVERDEAGEITHMLGAILDVTDQKRLEAELRQARAEAEDAARVKSDFLANMSHELRTPLSSIIGFTGLAAAQPDMPELSRTFVGKVHEASQALLCTVNDILDFSKLEAGQVAIHPQPTSVDKLCRSTLELFAPQAGAKDLNLIYDGPQGDDLVLGVDPDRVRQILLNLVGNAVKFTDHGEVRLYVRYLAGEGRLSVEVVDTGAGVPADKLARLFQRFSQIDGSLTRAGGTGLGLAICKGLVEVMGGQIGVESSPGAGSRFWFNLPAAPAVLVETKKAEADLAYLSALGLRVLVVDDHPANRQVASLFLSGIGAEVTEAVDGEDAVRLAGEWPFDVILMDMRMPKLDGPAALKRIREQGGLNDCTPILAFTADAADSLDGRLLAMGFQGVVAKPTDSTTLIAAVFEAAATVAPPEGYRRAG